MPSARPAGSGGAGFPNLGPTPNTFANNAARNTQATSDSDWLDEYNDNRNLHILVGVDIQRRNAAGDGWERLRWS